MSDNKGFETMRDLVRALQQAEYGLRTGELALEDLDKACHNANALHERLVVIRHKAREAHVREQAMQTAKAQAPKGPPSSAILASQTCPRSAGQGSPPDRLPSGPGPGSPRDLPPLSLQMGRIRLSPDEV